MLARNAERIESFKKECRDRPTSVPSRRVTVPKPEPPVSTKPAVAPPRSSVAFVRFSAARAYALLLRLVHAARIALHASQSSCRPGRMIARVTVRYIPNAGDAMRWRNYALWTGCIGIIWRISRRTLPARTPACATSRTAALRAGEDPRAPLWRAARRADLGA